MTTYARSEGGEVVERIAPEPGSLEDHRLSAAILDESSGWSVHYDEATTDEPVTAHPDAGTSDETTAATAGRPPRSPRGASSASKAGEGTDG